MPPGPGAPRGRVLAALSLLLPLAACGPPLPAAPAGAPLALLGERAPEWVAAGREASLAMAAGKWGEASRRLERRIALYPAPGEGGLGPVLGEGLRVDFYNLACMRALSGETVPALDALEQSLRDGCGFLGFDHLREDPDLDPLREEPRFRALLEGLSWNEVVELEGPSPSAAGAGGAPHALAVFLDAGDPPGPGGPGELPGPGGLLRARPRAPYREGPDRFAWTTRLDPGERAARKAVFAVEAAAARFPVDRGRVVLVADGPRAAAVAWEVLLRRRGAFTHAVVRGPAPPAWVLRDRGGESLPTRVLAVGEESVPPPPLRVEVAGSVGEALRRVRE